MRELREDTFSGNKDEDVHDHIDRVLNIVGLFNILEVSKDAVMVRIFPFTLTGSAKRYCPPSMTAKQLEDIYNFNQEGDESLYQAREQYNDLLYKCPTHDINSHQKTMADHSQKWQDETTSRNIRSRSSKDGLIALVNKLDNLGRDMKKLKETPFNGNNGGKFPVGPHGYYTKIDNRPSYGERRQSLEELLAKHQEESARRSTEMEVWIKKLQENAKINTRNQNTSLKNLETQIEQLTEELRSGKEKSEQANVVIVEHEGPISPKKIKNLYGISFLSDSQEENTNDQLPMKESNPGHFMLPCIIGNFNFYAMADLGAGVNCNENSHDKKPRARDYTFKEWVKLNKGHLDISKSVRKDLFRSWVIDQFTKALDPDKNPLERCLDEYDWNKDWWYDYWYEDEEKMKLRNKDYDLPIVHTETFEVTKYKFNNGCSFICVSGENNETLSLGRKTRSRFRKMIMEEMEEVLGNDREDSNNET
ncbi:hypothetical protein Tco_0052093 [Tanacetum coccineum]